MRSAAMMVLASCALAVLACVGAKGDTGAQGPAGPQGSQGPAGAQGPSWVDGGASGAIASQITIRARSDCGSVAPVPHMVLFLEQQQIAEWDVPNASYADFVANIPTTRYAGEADVAFTNDSDAGTCDHNLYVESLQVGGQAPIPATRTDAVIYDKGAFFDGVDVSPGQNLLDATGALRFFVGPSPSHAVRIYRNQVAFGTLSCSVGNALPGEITFFGNAGEWATLTYSVSGRTNACGHVYTDVYLDSTATANQLGAGGVDERGCGWRRTLSQTFHRRLTTSGSHVFRIILGCGSGAASFTDTGGEWPTGGLSWMVTVGG